MTNKRNGGDDDYRRDKGPERYDDIEDEGERDHRDQPDCSVTPGETSLHAGVIDRPLDLS